MLTMNTDGTEIITTNDLDKKQTGTDQVVIHLPPTYTHLNTGNIPNLYYPQPIPICPNGQNMPAIMMGNGTNLNNPMTQQVVNIPEYRTWSIVNILFCCWLLGLLACIKSQKAREKKRCADVQGALNASKSAKILNIFATAIGTITIITVSILAATRTIDLYSYQYG